jgi:thiol-disulfide isomerase/thioredoxin
MSRTPAPPPARSGRLLFLATAVVLLAGACGSAPPQLTAPASSSSSSSPSSMSSPSSSSSSAAEGEPVLAPELQVTLFDGTPFDLAEHLSRDGRPVLLHLWSSSCPICLEELPYLDEAARRHPEVLFLGVAVQDDPDQAAAAAAELGVTYPLGADPAGSVAAAFPSPGLPATFLIGSDGTLLGAVYGALDPGGIEALVARYLGG